MRGLLSFLATASVALVGITTNASAASDFVRVQGTHFELHGKPYYFVGTNFWYGMNLGAEGPAGNRPRLIRELDRLQKLGVGNLRIMAATEGPDSEAWRIVPSVQPSAGVYDESMLRGLDFLLQEMGKRGMRAVICLGNFWHWSGGMSQYLAWSGAGAIPYPPPAAGGSWSGYQAYTEKFYTNEKALRLQSEFVRAVVTRKNAYTGAKYADDPAIMAWELANEPRGGSDPEAFNQWLKSASQFIKSLDSNHLVTTGSEGETPWPAGNGLNVVRNHSYASIDYVTAHIWAQNWGWFDPADVEGTLPVAVAKMDAYLRDHAAKAAQTGKPFVIEEFGIDRDGNSYDPASATAVRDRYYAEVFARVYELARAKSAVAGVNFWAWGGEARPEKPFGGAWRAGLPFLGDPPHEAQGWYSIYDTDLGTQKVIRDYALKMSGLQ